MKKEELQMIAFQMIAKVGEAKSIFMEAINEAENREFEKADSLILEGNKLLGECGSLHLPVVSAEANNMSLEYSVIFMHAEDQYMTTELLKSLAEKFINVYKSK